MHNVQNCAIVGADRVYLKCFIKQSTKVIVIIIIIIIIMAGSYLNILLIVINIKQIFFYVWLLLHRIC